MKARARMYTRQPPNKRFCRSDALSERGSSLARNFLISLSTGVLYITHYIQTGCLYCFKLQRSSGNEKFTDDFRNISLESLLSIAVMVYYRIFKNQYFVWNFKNIHAEI